MHKFAELLPRLLKLLGGRRQRSPESITEDDGLALRIVARLRAECEKPQAHTHAEKIA